MTPTLREELDRIEDFLMGSEGGELADILAALRGPDVGGNLDSNLDAHVIKLATTVPIRVAAFPRLAKKQATEPAGGVYTGPLNANSRWAMLLPSGGGFDMQMAEMVSYHFRKHIEVAANILGLR